MIHAQIDLNEPLTDTQNAMLNALISRPVEPDEDCPVLTDTQLAQFKKVGVRILTEKHY